MYVSVCCVFSCIHAVHQFIGLDDGVCNACNCRFQSPASLSSEVVNIKEKSSSLVSEPVTVCNVLSYKWSIISFHKGRANGLSQLSDSLVAELVSYRAFCNFCHRLALFTFELT